MKRYLLVLIMMAGAVSMAATHEAAKQASGHPAKTRAQATPLVMEARKALFEESQLDRARQLSQQELKQDPDNVEALFIEMEAAALEADSASELQAALKLCESRPSLQSDPRVTIAAARVLDLAANTEDFRGAIPRIEAMLASGMRSGRQAHANYLRAALIAAAADGAPRLNLAQLARAAGLISEWRVAGPFGHYGNIEFDQHWQPEQDALLNPATDGHAVERLMFDDGTFRLPDYFARDGVYYAAGEMRVRATQNLIVRAESAGTLEILVDGGAVLRKDDRFRVNPEIAWRTLRLRAGVHRVVVKFLPSAAPFRVALIPTAARAQTRGAISEIDDRREAAYVAAAQKFWAGDSSGVITALNADRMRPAVTNFLLYQAWTHVAEDSPEATAMLNAALQVAPAAMAAEYQLAWRAYSADRTDEALARLQRVVSAREKYEPARQLLAEMAINLNWPVLAESALEIQLRVHPSCDVLLQGYKFFAGHARYERSRELRRHLADCAPDTLAYERSLMESGEHAQAAAAAEADVARRPLDRAARELLVRELAMSGQTDKARVAAQELAEVAPNSARYRRMAQISKSNPLAVLDRSGLRDVEAERGDVFYSQFRRDGVAMVRKTNDRKFSGGPALTLVNDRVARLWEDGSVSLYVHRMTRMLDRDGIEKYGEATVPSGADVLELRTIKADGTVVEPELTPEKNTVSMPALAAGDAIDEEYVEHYANGGMAEHPEAFRHTFGSFTTPMLYSRFIVIVPADEPGVRAHAAPGIVPAREEVIGKARVRTWEKDDIPQAVEEVATARGDVLPTAGVEPTLAGGWGAMRDRFRNELVDALRIGPRVARMAAQVRAREPQTQASEIFRAVANAVRPAGFNPESMMSAEETLAGGSGNRTIAVLAVARAAGLDADLVLARDGGWIVRDTRASLHLYNRPLVRFRFAGQEVFADAESEGLGFGAIPPSIERHDALLVPVFGEHSATVADNSPILPLPSNTGEQSVAEADVTLDSKGGLTADVTIRMGAWRGAQMRSILAGIEPAQRPRYYQQLAGRIFAGAEEVSGTTRNENDPDRPLELELHCRSTRFVELGRNSADIGQLVPALGLRKMYAGGTRRYPLYIDTPFVESASFRVHLPAGVTVAGTTPELNVSGAFGSYSLKLRQISPGVLEVQRAFRIPTQLVGPERYPEFSNFAGKIDDVERQRIPLQVN